jgi:carbon monoxide dehydrogenase subunit G
MKVPASTVWEYLLAFEQVPLWEHGVNEVRQLTPGDPVIGTLITARRVYAGRETQLSGEVVAIEPGRSATLSLRGGPHVESRVTYAVEPLGEARSRVTYSATGHLRGPLALLQPILPAVGRAEARKNLARLERRIAAGIPPRSTAPTPDR